MRDEFDLSTCSETELWHYVAGHLEASGIGVVLVGGAVVAVYTDGAYQSGDLDFVPERLFEDRIEASMRELGFHRKGRARHDVHPDCSHLFVEFVNGPLGIGSEQNIVPRTELVKGQSLKILSPTDCVCDRLASYIYHNARDCLDQAVLVTRSHSLDWKRLERWCQGEGPPGTAAFEDLKRLSAER